MASGLEHDAIRKAAKRASDRDLSVPPPAEINRRRDCLADVYLFLRTYFGGIFSQPFTPARRTMIDALLHAAKYGGDQAIAGPRGDGKTRSALFGSFFLEIQQQVRFPLIISKSGPRASRELANLKDAIRDSDTFLADFPELCVPILNACRWPSKARLQTVHGTFTDMEWGVEAIIFPTVPTELLRENLWADVPADIVSSADGQIMASLGIEGPIRGYSIRNERPDLAILDDIDDRESARSELQTETRERIIEEDIGGLAGPDRTISRLMLCTLINRTCIAARFTDKSVKPSWRPQRHKLLESNPERMELWEEYISMRQGRADDDPDARKAHAFYLENREAMDAGAAVSNPYRFDSRPLQDGEPGQVSALQACFDIIADRNWDHFNTEYQNDPPEESGPIESGITPHRIQKQLSGYPRKLVPPGCTKLVRGIDCRKVALHWVVRAWRPDGTGFTIDYGVHEVLGTVYGSDEGTDVALKRAILAYLEESKDAEYMTADGELRSIDRTLIDAGWRTDAVYAACREAGLGVMPVMGIGKSSGCVQANFSEVQRRTMDRKPGLDPNYFLSRKSGLWLVNANADHWKAWEHDRWMTVPTKPGSMLLFGESSERPERLSSDEKAHHSYARHICNEVEVEEPYNGTIRRKWKAKSENTHWLDASYYSDVAACMEGIRVISGKAAKAAKPAGDRPSLSQLAGRK